MNSSEQGKTAAQYARDNTTPGSAGYADLSTKMCWDAVIHCLSKSGAAPAEVAKMKPSADDYGTFIRPDDPVVDGPSDVRRMPQGAIIGFIDLGNKNRLIHAMVSVGAGLAAGNKNACLGIGNPIGWEILDLSKLGWVGGGAHFVAGGHRKIQARYRLI